MRKITKFFCFLFITAALFPQIRFKNYPNYNVTANQLKEIENSEKRELILLNGAWSVYAEKDKEKNRTQVVIPSVYEGDEELVFEKKFSLTQEQLNGHLFQLNFLGVNYSADISLNNSVIFRHTGGAFPFTITLPKDILKPGKDANLLSLRVIPQGEERNTIPLAYSFTSPDELAGIFRDVYISVLPNTAIQRCMIYKESVSSQTAKVRVDANIINRSFGQADSLGSQFEMRLSLLQKNGSSSAESGLVSFDVKKGKEKDVSALIEISDPALWSPENPSLYRIRIEILYNGQVVDNIIRDIGLYSLRPLHDSLLLNNQNFQMHGVNYVPVFKTFGAMLNYEQMKQDILFIKETGFNTVHITKTLAHPYLMQLCAEYGLLVIADIPMEGIPATILSDNLFLNLVKNYITQWIQAYNNCSSLAVVGLGTGYSTAGEGDNFVLPQFADIIRQKSRKLVYASFLPGSIAGEVQGLDLYGFEFLNREMKDVDVVMSSAETKIGKGRLLLTAGFWPTEGSSNGYANPSTYEAQAKYYSDLLEYADSKDLPGVFIESMFDYRSSYHSIIGSYNKDMILPSGIATEDRTGERTAYKVVYASLHNLQKVTVPIGVKKDKSPLVFVIFGLFLALMVGVLANSGRKFREDAMRALVRPYNFFADVRDLRIFSPIQSILLGLIVSAVFALITSSYLHYFRQNMFFEKLLLSLSGAGLMKSVSYLAWHPFSGLIVLTLLYFVLAAVIGLIVRAGAMMTSNKVFFSSSFYMVVWSCVPVVVLIPFGIVLYRILLPGTFNIFIYAFTVVFFAWMLLRIFKGSYVIYDSLPGKVYFAGTILLLVCISSAAFYMHYHYLSLDFIMQAIKELRQGI